MTKDSTSLTLHWSPRSPFVRKVMLFAHETGLASRLTLVRSVVAMTTPNQVLMRDNPLSKIPTLVLGDGSALYDSAVICDYLDTLHAGPRRIPGSGAARWQVLRWQSLGNGLLDALVLWRNERDKPSERQTEAWMSSFQTKLDATLAALEAEAPLLQSTLLSGHARGQDKPEVVMNLGHVSLVCALGYLDFRFSDIDWRSGHPALAGWFAPLALRPSYQATLPGE
jgi:glutathione S-transferase